MKPLQTQTEIPKPGPGNRMGKDRRMIRTGDFGRAFRGGSRAKSTYLTVVVLEREGPTRLGLSVGKRVYKLAHDRNRLKRRMREAFRQSQFELPDGLDIILIPVQPRCLPTVVDLKKELVYLAAKAHKRLRAKRATQGVRT